MAEDLLQQGTIWARCSLHGQRSNVPVMVSDWAACAPHKTHQRCLFTLMTVLPLINVGGSEGVKVMVGEMAARNTFKKKWNLMEATSSCSSFLILIRVVVDYSLGLLNSCMFFCFFWIRPLRREQGQLSEVILAHCCSPHVSFTQPPWLDKFCRACILIKTPLTAPIMQLSLLMDCLFSPSNWYLL